MKKIDKKFGFLRENQEWVDKDPYDKDTGLCRTSIEVYLKAIYPNTNDWINDKVIPKSGRKFRPDWRSESLKLIIEFDGTPHYASPVALDDDNERNKFYESLGYKVIRIPFFIQLSNKVVERLFGVVVKEELFDEKYPSMGAGGGSSFAYMCPEGIKRAVKEFMEISPEQYVINYDYLNKLNNPIYTGIEYVTRDGKCKF